MNQRSGKVAIVWRGERPADAIPQESRLRPVSDALEQRGLIAVPVVYSEEMSASVREQLLGCGGVLVWVDPLTNGRTRGDLDALLRDVASQGVSVSAHPDVVLKMGTKEILYRTRHLGWGTDIALYGTIEEFRSEFPSRLLSSGPRVLKQYRGNGGQGVWKVAVTRAGSDPVVRLREATNRDGASEEMKLGQFMGRCEAYFSGDGRIVDQQFQPRIVDGMVRCYMSGSTLVGFARQYPKGYGQDASSENTFGLPADKTMLPPDESQFRTLRSNLEQDWTPKMREIVDLDESSMPALWDADFLFGPKDAKGADSFVLCEINASCVSPFPKEAPAKIADVMKARLNWSERI
ncbi:MAG: Cj0069 family protein [Proteobacteria bacterium]|nr:Cj0069 family protein [Pseudomonadota bacterium]